MPYGRDSDSDEPVPKGCSKKELKRRIEGFGNSPMPPPVSDSPSDFFWSSMSGDQTFESWYNSAQASVNSILDAVDDTVNTIADAVDDTIAAVIGEDDDEPYPDPEPPRRRAGPQNRRAGEEDDDDQSADGSQKKDKKKKKKEREDHGDRSGVDWPQVVGDICVEGNLEEFVLFVRSQVKNEFEEKEVGSLLAEQLLNEVQADVTLRILHVMQAIVSDHNLPFAKEVIQTRCVTKLNKLQATGYYSKIAKDILSDQQENGASSEAAAAASSKKPVESVDTMDLLDMAAPTNGASSSSASSTAKASPSAKAKPTEPEDLLGFGNAPKVAPLPPPPGAAAFKRGDRVRAVWAGDNNRYPAVVDSVRGQTVNVQWIRRYASAGPGEAFVADVGDDSTHEQVQASDVQLVAAGPVTPSRSSTSASAPGLGDLLDFDAPAKTQAGNQTESSLFDTTAATQQPLGWGTPTEPASAGTAFSVPSSTSVGFNATFPAFGAGDWHTGLQAPATAAAASPWPPPPAAAPAGFGGACGGGMRPAIPSMAAGLPSMAAGSTTAGGAASSSAGFPMPPMPSSGYSVGPAPGTMAAGASLGAGQGWAATPKAPSFSANPQHRPPVAASPAKKEIELGDAFELTAAFGR